MSYSRCASHSDPNGNGWYPACPKILKDLVDNLFEEAKSSRLVTLDRTRKISSIISPHAGISFSGKTARLGYWILRNYINDSGNETKRIFVLGPSHHSAFEGAQVSRASDYETPFGNIEVDTSLAAKVVENFSKADIPCSWTTRRVDEDEHSIEMQMPFISHILHFPMDNAQEPAKRRIKIVPVIIGITDRVLERRMAEVLREYISDDKNLFIFSSDFCHWGSRFAYTYHYEPKSYPKISDSIFALDHLAITKITEKDIEGWYEYFAETHNTICGKNPLGIGMHLWQDKKFSIEFIGYSQSNVCKSPRNSCVAYASAVVIK